MRKNLDTRIRLACEALRGEQFRSHELADKVNFDGCSGKSVTSISVARMAHECGYIEPVGIISRKNGARIWMSRV